MTEKVEITLNINGRDHTIRVEPRRTLVDAIRDDCGQTGTHIGCEHGICGACTIILDDDAVRSCLMFAVQAQGKRIRTVEGLKDGDKLHPMQSAFMTHHRLAFSCWRYLPWSGIQRLRTRKFWMFSRRTSAVAQATRISSKPCGAPPSKRAGLEHADGMLDAVLHENGAKR
jgi:hypothetical protein